MEVSSSQNSTNSGKDRSGFLKIKLNNRSLTSIYITGNFFCYPKTTLYDVVLKLFS